MKPEKKLIKPIIRINEKVKEGELIRPLSVSPGKFIVPCDSWIPMPSDLIFKQVKGAIIAPVSEFYGVVDNGELDYFHLDIKQRCYNSEEMRFHCTQYLNYFERFYDEDKELLSIYCTIKYLIDYVDEYDQRTFIHDIRNKILGMSILSKVKQMNLDNYSLDLNSYSNDKNPGLRYNNTHARILMEISVLMNMCIPLLTHFLFRHKEIPIKDFLLNVFDIIISMYSDTVDIYSKLYETSITNINKSKGNHEPIWMKQAIRGKNTTTHAIYTVNNIILQIIPKYTYNQNLVHFNYQSVLKNIKYQIVDISFEFSFFQLSNTKLDADSNSEFDKFESFQTKADESLYVQNKVNAESTMALITERWGPFEEDEILFYYHRLSNEKGELIMNPFQRNLVFNLFYNYFGDPQSIKAINIIDYIKLIIAGRRMLEVSGLIALPYIISSKVSRLVTRKNINKKELMKIESSPYYPFIKEKYKSDKINREILSIIAIILSSEFEFIEYNDTEGLDGQITPILSDFVIEEVLIYILMI